MECKGNYFILYDKARVIAVTADSFNDPNKEETTTENSENIT